VQAFVVMCTDLQSFILDLVIQIVCFLMFLAVYYCINWVIGNYLAIDVFKKNCVKGLGRRTCFISMSS
jgi:hypothetical protein